MSSGRRIGVGGGGGFAGWRASMAPPLVIAGAALFLSAGVGPHRSLLQATEVVLNEVLPAPREVDWDGDGTTDARKDEWVELHNLGSEPVDLGGWVLDDIPDGGTPPFAIPPGTSLAAGGLLVLFGSETGVGLNNGGDTVRILRPDGTVADAFTYSALSGFYDRSFSRDPDGTGDWTDELPPSPGDPNVLVPGATPTGSPTAAATSTPTLTATAMAVTSPSPVLSLLITEVLYDGTAPASEGDEFVEILNPNPKPADLHGYLLGDEETPGGGEGMYDFPAGSTVGAGELVLIAKNATAFRARFGFDPDFEARAEGDNFPDTLVVPDLIRQTDLASGHWALANAGDEFLLFGPDGSLLDSIVYGSGDRAAAGVIGDERAPAPLSLQRAGTQDTDDMEADFAAEDPNPGILSQPLPTPTATLPTLQVVWLNEFLPQPGRDWNGDGRTDTGDEWIELYNPGAAPGDLSGWQLDDIAGGGSTPFVVPERTVIAGDGYLVLFGAQTGVRLNDAGDSVRLLRPDGSLADEAVYEESPGRDRGLSRPAPGPGPWSADFLETPGAPNQPRPPETLSEVEDTASISAARGMVAGTEVVTSGQVSIPPGVLGPRILYLQATGAGIRVRLAEGTMPSLPLGAWLRVRGEVAVWLGEREILVEGPGEMARLRDGPPVVPEEVVTGSIAPRLAGRLVRAMGYVSGAQAGGDALWLDDGTGPILVDLGSRTDGSVLPGEFLEAVAVVGVADRRLVLRLRYLEELRPPDGVRWLPVAGLQILGTAIGAAAG
ncbi:MAG: lamin tail domain-containing protein [Anaerolineae bacterium]